MNPIINKKDFETTIDEIRKFAYTYLEKHDSSKQQLRTYLFKKFLKKNQKTSNKKEFFNLIDIVISTLIDQKFLSDRYYSDTKSKSFLRSDTEILKSKRSEFESVFDQNEKTDLFCNDIILCNISELHAG